jgi:hypothetical protein
MIASHTPLPVIGVPVQSKALNGLDSLLSIVQMPAGVPVATVAIGNAKNAGLLAVKMLAIADPKLLEKIIEYKIKWQKNLVPKTNILLINQGLANNVQVSSLFVRSQTCRTTLPEPRTCTFIPAECNIVIARLNGNPTTDGIFSLFAFSCSVSIFITVERKILLPVLEKLA